MTTWNFWVGLVTGILVGTAYHAWVERRLVRADKWINWKVFHGILKETLSSRGGRAIKRKLNGELPLKGDGVWCLLCKFLDLLQKDHCINNIQIVPGQPNPPE